MASMYNFLPPGNCTTGINPCHILSLIAQVVSPKYSAACLSGKRRGDIGFGIPCASECLMPSRFAMLCPPLRPCFVLLLFFFPFLICEKPAPLGKFKANNKSVRVLRGFPVFSLYDF